MDVKDIDTFYTKNADKIDFISAPVTNPQGTHKICFCKDFENNLIELVQTLEESEKVTPKITKRGKREKVVTPARQDVKMARRTRGKLPPNPFKAKAKQTISMKELNREYKEPKE